MFIGKDEHIIIMDECSHPLSQDALIRLRGSGIRTIYAQGLVYLERMQSTPFGQIDWSVIDVYMERIKKADLRVLMPDIYHFPMWMPNDWYFSHERAGIPSYTNADMAKYIDDYYHAILERYPYDWFQLVYGMPENGEFADSYLPRPDHPIPPAQIAQFVVDRQKILSKQHNEVWTAFHWNGSPNYMDVVYTALKDNFPDCAHFAVQYTYYNQPPEINMPVLIKRAQTLYNIRYFVGSQYCEGLRDNLENAVNFPLDLLCAPIHSFTGHQDIEDWMLDVIKNGIARYAQSKD